MRSTASPLRASASCQDRAGKASRRPSLSLSIRRQAGAAIPIEDDYNVVRQGIWWATNRQYKTVTENHERKLAFMKTKMIEDQPDDFSREEPAMRRLSSLGNEQLGGVLPG